jgi:NADPH:quinone reductase-like Zn-dependent oxidoreductase
LESVVRSAYGPPEVLRLADVPVPTLARGEARIRIRATAVASSGRYSRRLDLNRGYGLLARLAIGWGASRRPILGMVLSGEVEAVGESVTRLRVGGLAIRRASR